jgi:ADP-ribose pyrophosphatase YjhB (NUDIX family)
VVDLTEAAFTERELMLIKVRAVGKEREEMKRMADIFRGSIIDVTEKSYTIELTGDASKLDAFIGAIDRTAILETVRTGTSGIGRGERILLGRKPEWPPGRFSTVAGFVEPGESLEEAVRREMREESGIPVGEVRYHSSQPWPFPHSLMVAFHCDYVSGDITPQEGEIEAAADAAGAAAAVSNSNKQARLCPPANGRPRDICRACTSSPCDTVRAGHHAVVGAGI